MVIRYMNAEEVYFSLNDVADLLTDDGILTSRQNKVFRVQCQGYVSRELAKAYKNKHVCDSLQPIILPGSDYFVHHLVWAALLMLLPKAAAQQRKINYLNFMLSEPDSIYRYPSTFKAVDLICLTRWDNRSVTSLPGPLMVETRDN